MQNGVVEGAHSAMRRRQRRQPRLESDRASVDPTQVGPQLLAAVRAGRGHELLPFAGQSAQLVHDIVPAADLVARLMADSADALRRASQLAPPGVTADNPVTHSRSVRMTTRRTVGWLT